MAGRGRGRGRGRGMPFPAELLGYTIGEPLPGANLQPPALYPPLDYKPVPVEKREESSYLLELKQEYRSAMKDSPFYIKTLERKKDIERYSDKYQMNGQDGNSAWEPDWSRLPAELQPRKRRRAPKSIEPNLPAKANKIESEEIIGKLEELANKEATEGAVEEGGGDEDNEGEEGDDVEEEFLDDDELEDDNDYNLNYFDNGEGYGVDEDDDLDEGPIY